MENLREGIWQIRKIANGVHCRFESNKIEELPEIMLRASFEPYRNVIFKKLYKFQKDGNIELTAGEVVKIIFESLKKK